MYVSSPNAFSHTIQQNGQMLAQTKRQAWKGRNLKYSAVLFIGHTFHAFPI